MDMRRRNLVNHDGGNRLENERAAHVAPKRCELRQQESCRAWMAGRDRMRTAARAGTGAETLHAPRNGHHRAEEQPPEPAPQPEQSLQPAPDATPSVTYIEVMVGEMNIVNHYGCQGQPKHATMEVAPRGGVEEDATVENLGDQRTSEWITVAHAAHCSEEYWGKGRGRSRQTILDQLNKFVHVKSAKPPTGGPRGILIDQASFLAFDRRVAPAVDPSGKAQRKAS